MPRRQADDDASKGRGSTRRTFMKTVGLAASAAVGATIVGSPGAASGTIDLGEQGLSDGDDIDPYLEEHFVDGNEVYVPPGEYDYSGSGLGGSKSNCSLLGDPDGVVFHRPDDPEVTVRPTIWATSGTVRFENITVRGKRGEAQSRWRVGAASGATVEFVNVNMPDGTVEGSDSTGIYAGTDHAGTLKVRHCYFSDFGNVACYVSDPYVEGNGRVVVEECDFVNTGMSALRLAPDDSEVRGCYFEATEKAASSHVGWNQRGIKIDDAGDNVVIEDCDFLWTDVGNMPINFDDKGEGGSGVIRDVRIRNDGDTPTFVDEWGVGGNWEGQNVHLTGSGSHDAPDGFETVTGSDAQEPNTEYGVWTPEVEDGEWSNENLAVAAAAAGVDVDPATRDRVTVDGETEIPAAVAETSGSTSLRTVHDGYSGEGFIDLEPRDGGRATWYLDVASGGAYDMVVTYSQGDSDLRTADLVVNDDRGEIGFEPTGSWETWEQMAVTVHLSEGANDVALETTGEDAGHVDTIRFVPADSADDTETETETETPTETETDSGSDRDADDGTGGGSLDYEKVLLIDGTGDAVETARYSFRVSGEVVRDAEYSETTSDSTPWDRLTDQIDDNSVVGVVGNGVDAYGYTGTLTEIDVRGKASFTIVSR